MAAASGKQFEKIKNSSLVFMNAVLRTFSG